MNAKDQERLLKAISAMAEYYGKQLSDGILALYLNGLASYPVAEIERALQAHVQNPDTGQWMPKIADIVKMLEGTSQSASAIAWGKVYQAVSDVGMYRSLAFDDPIIHLAITDIGGWQEICKGQEAELCFLQSRFEKSYRAYAHRRHDLPPYPRYLAGIFECENRLHGYPVDPPVLVGDPQRASMVLANGSNKTLVVSVAQAAQDTINRIRLAATSEKTA